MNLRFSRRFRRWLAPAVIWMMVPLAALSGRATAACVCADGRVQSLCPILWPSAAAGSSCCSRQPTKASCCQESGPAAGKPCVQPQAGSCCRSVLATAAVEVRRAESKAGADEGAHAAAVVTSLPLLVADAVAAGDIGGTSARPAPADLPIVLSRLTI